MFAAEAGDGEVVQESPFARGVPRLVRAAAAALGGAAEHDDRREGHVEQGGLQPRHEGRHPILTAPQVLGTKVKDMWSRRPTASP